MMSFIKMRSKIGTGVILLGICLGFSFTGSIMNIGNVMKVVNAAMKKEIYDAGHLNRFLNVSLKGQLSKDEKNVEHEDDNNNDVSRPNITHPVPVVFYNRVPKCGSSLTIQLTRHMSNVNNFRLISSRQYMTWWMDRINTMKYIRRFKSTPPRVLFERHMHFVDFKSFSLEQPVYINLIRDPFDRLVSWYYYKRFQLQEGLIKNMTEERRNMTYDECVQKNDPECTSIGQDTPEEGYFKQIPFFCGPSLSCRLPTDASLAQAIHNVKNYFLVVGVTENLEDYFKVLEKVIPEYFTGAPEEYYKINHKAEANFGTHHKVPATNNTRQLMREHLLLENRFYQFVKERFEAQMKSLFG